MNRYLFIVLAITLLAGCASVPRGTECTTTAERWGIMTLAVLEAVASNVPSSWNGDLGVPCP